MPDWRVDLEVQPDHTVHVWPEQDGIEHDLIDPCICGPRLEEMPNGRVLVRHHSLDAGD